jgi:hypothetical protein
MDRLTKIAFTVVCMCFICAISVHAGFAQTSTQKVDTLNQSNIKGPLEFKGFAEELTKKLKGAIVTLYESTDGSKNNLTEVLKTVTSGNGQFEFKLEVNKFYVLVVEKGGYTTKKVDFDTDVRLSRNQYSKVATFEFRVDMVQDLDGLDFAGSVASVFYQIKLNEFDYQLDYSKEEMEEEERLLREQEEKRRMAELAAQNKFEIEEAAKLLREDENASAQELIKAAITVGDGNKEKTIKGFLQVFPEVDTLRDRKVLAMYNQLQEERKTSKASGGEINFQAIFSVANKLEETVVAVAEKKQAESVGELRKEKEEAERKLDEAIAIKQQSLELESREKLASAVKSEELRKAKEEKGVRDKVYYAIFNSGGDGDVAVQNLIKTYAKNDPYKEEKAKSLYAQYEKIRLTGSTLSKMDFGKLFAAADEAEQQAIQKDIQKDNFKQQSKMDAFMDKVEEKKVEEQKEVIDKIQEGLKTAKSDRISQVEVFKNALAKNDPYKEEKANAMYNEYVKKKQNLEGSSTAAIDFSSLFQVADAAEEKAKVEAKEQLFKEKQKAQEQLEAQREELLKEKSQLANEKAAQMEEVLGAKMAVTKNKKEKKLAEALESGAGNRDNSIEAIVKVLEPTGDKELDQERAEAIYDAYLDESKKINRSGNVSSTINFGVLFQAADKAELARLERKYEQKQAVEEERLAEYTESRIEKATDIAKAKQIQAEKEVGIAEQTYQETVHKVEAQQTERLAAEKKQDEELAKRKAMELAKRESIERDNAAAELANIKAGREKRLNEERAANETLAAAEAAERAKQKLEVQEEASRRLAQAEKAQDEVELAKLKAKEEKRKEEEKRLADADKAQREAELAYQRTEERRLKEEADRIAAIAKVKEELEIVSKKELALKQKAEADLLAANEKAGRDAEWAEKKLEEERLREEAEQLANAAKAKEEAELAAKKEQERKLKEEASRLAAEAKLKEAAALAAKKEEERKLKEEADRLVLAAKAKQEAELATQKEEERRLKEEANRLAAETKAEEAATLAVQKEEERKLKEESDRLAANAKAKEEAELAAKKEQERILKEKASQLAAEAKSKEEALLAAAKAADEARKAEEKRQTELADQQAEDAEKQKLDRYNSLIQKGDGAVSGKDYGTAKKSYSAASVLYPNNSDAKTKLSLAERELARVEKENADRLALNNKFDGLMKDAESEVANEQYEEAINKLEQASILKPNEQQPKQRVRDIKRTIELVAQAEKEKQAKERKYVVLMQDGKTALAARNIEKAKDSFQQAANIKPQENEPTAMLNEVEALETELALIEEEKKQKEEEAKKKFEDQQRLAQAKKDEELAARLKALEEADQAIGNSATAEEARIKKYEQLKQSIEQMDLAAEEQRSAFLSELSKIYPEGMTKEKVQGKNFELLRYVINSENIVTIYEKKMWDWGGVFYFKDADIAITEAIYKLEIGKFE